MKSCLRSRQGFSAVVFLLLALSAPGDVEAKRIRLQNETIDTGALNRQARTATLAPSAPASGLYLIQFKNTLAPEARDQIAAYGVDLLHFVPEDSYVARFRNVRLDLLRALPFVEWVGLYRPEHKVHGSLREGARKRLVAGLSAEPMAVTVLVIPRATGAEVVETQRTIGALRQQSTLRSGTVLRGTASQAQLDALARSDSVLWLEEARDMKLFDEVASKLVGGDAGPHQMLTQALGYDGSGVTVSVADSGLHNGDPETMHPDLSGRTTGFFFYGTLLDAADEHSHGTHVAGIVAGNGSGDETDENDAWYGLGVAPGAEIVAQRIFDGAGGYHAPPSYEKLTRDALRAGADIGSNSWGDDTQGRYDVSAMEFDELVRDADGLALGNQQYILEFSAGNAGPGAQTIGSPAVGKNVIATGASENDRLDFIIYGNGTDFIADFSSRGPCADGRIKPDVVAPGTWIASLQSASATDQYAWAAISPLYQYQGGTSQAGPHASGAAAVFVQYYRENHGNATPSPALVKAALINSATDLGYSGPAPNHDQGWGRIDLPVLLDSGRSFEFFDQTAPLTNGQVFEHRVVISGADEPLKITLTYTDVPGFPASVAALVNDLDLEVLAPDGFLYRGNQFEFGESAPNVAARDSINNVEAVHLSLPVPGEYLVRVRARSVAQDARVDTPAIDQDFALVVSGVMPELGVGAVLLDRATYTAPSQIKITLIDTDLSGLTSILVRAQSGTEATPETVVLRAATSSGVLTGAIATATGPALNDGRLQLAHNDNIVVSYFDASANSNRSGTARADLAPPVLTEVASSSSFGQVVISWASDEPATSLVRFGTNASLASLTLSATNAEHTTRHSMTLNGLVAGRTYYYYVASTDEAGNTGVNSNTGSFYSFFVNVTAPVLLIDEYQDPFFGTPPLSGYTDALSQTGVDYDVWVVEERGEPELANLQPYRSVIWRVPEIFGAWSATERSAISNYLHSGGSLFVASMEVLSRLEEQGAGSFIKDVLHVQSYTADVGASQIVGPPNDVVGNGLDIAMDYVVYQDLWGSLGGFIPPDASDTIVPSTNASPVLLNEFGGTVGLRWPGAGQTAPGRLVLLTIPLDAVPLEGGVNDRVQLLRNVLSFLAPGAPGLSTISLSSPAYTLPARAVVELGDADLAGSQTITITALSDTQTNGTPVMLFETARAGVFRGFFDLLAATNAPTAGALLAKDGDMVRVAHYDAASGITLSAAAVVDTVAPAITNVFAEADYEEATVSWETTEAADTLVQFGESPFLGRTAYDASPTTSHEVRLPALAPDRTYYYRVVSRDTAGNTATDDNQGRLYTFRTRLPLVPPWSDNLDTGATNWSVFSVEDSQAAWTLTTPNNAEISSAHSPPFAWGCNPGGGVLDYAESFLISPALYLTNGNSATLTFWHWYDFVESSGFEIQFATLEIVTNSAGATIPILDFSGDLSGDWIEEEVDLTPYMGHVVYLVWHYVLFSLDAVPRLGWYVDDVSINVSSVTRGSVEISNNLAQSSFVLSGPLYFTGTGLGAVVTNAPPGEYVLEYADVPYYVTPAAQTNTLEAGGTLRLNGNYVLPDANHNGMSDLWEQAWFGNVSTNRTQMTDTDGDRVADSAEFAAGTDPTNPNSYLRATAAIGANGLVIVSWTSAPQHAYRMLGSTNALDWSPVSGWMQAGSNGGPMSCPVPTPSAGTPNLFRIQVQP